MPHGSKRGATARGRGCQVALKPRLVALRQDIVWLTEFDGQMMNKVQFLLDGTMGFLNIEQSNGIKVLTVVSVVGFRPP
jgi:magnesium transporter